MFVIFVCIFNGERCMSEYRVVQRASCASLELCPSDAVTCWVDVYDRKPQHEGAVRLRCGYISDAVEPEDLLSQLEEFLPLDQWKQLICCSPGDFGERFCLLVSSTDLAGPHPRMRVLDRLGVPGYHNLIFHNEANGLGKQQLVIVRKRFTGAWTKTWSEQWPVAPGGREYDCV